MEEYKKIIQDTFLLTETEKTKVIGLIEKNHSKTIQALDSYKTSKDASKFYEDMRSVIKEGGEGEEKTPGGSFVSASYSSYTPKAHTDTAAAYPSYSSTSYSYKVTADVDAKPEVSKSSYSFEGIGATGDTGASPSYSFDYSKYANYGSTTAEKKEEKHDDQPTSKTYSYANYLATSEKKEEKKEEESKPAASNGSYSFGNYGGASTYGATSTYGGYNPVSDLYTSTLVAAESSPHYGTYTSTAGASGIHVGKVHESFESLAEKIPLKTLEPNSFFLSCLLGSPKGCDKACFTNMVKAFLPSHASNDAEIGQLFDAMDQDKDNRLDPKELAAGLEKAMDNQWDPPVKKIWRAITSKDPESQIAISKKALEYADPGLVSTFLQDVNIEGSKEISFWQLVRSQTKQSVFEMYAAVNQKLQMTGNSLVPGGGSSMNLANLEEKKTISKAKLIIKVKRVFNLERIDPLLISTLFKDVDFSDVTLDNFTEVMSVLNQGIVSNSVFNKTCKELFMFMDLDGNGTLEREELLISLLTLTTGSEIEKIKAAFALFDLDGNGVLSLPEVATYIYSLFIMAKRTDLSLKERTKKELLEIATSTAQKAFKDIDKNGDGIISQEEFANWVQDKDPNATHNILIRAVREKTSARRGTLASRPFEHDINQRMENINEHIGESKAHSHLIEEIRKDIPFDKIHIKDAFEFLEASITNLTAVTKPQFNDYVRKLLKKYQIEVKFPDSFDRVLKLFFTVFDENSDGTLNIQELAAGLHMICGGNKKEKISQTVRFYDKDKNNRLDFMELTDYFYFTFRLLFTSNPDDHIRSMNPLKVAKATASRAFREMGEKETGSLLFNDFIKWAEKSL